MLLNPVYSENYHEAQKYNVWKKYTVYICVESDGTCRNFYALKQLIVANSSEIYLFHWLPCT
jgi:hypothetical protein